ncbi:MAG: F0F1 ATP synthase subunit delta [Patescibacteria group bacterium]
MKYTSKQYAKVLVELVKDETPKNLSTIFGKFREMLSKNGDTKYLNDILFYFEKYLDEATGVVKVEVTTAADKPTSLPAKIGGKTVKVISKVDPTLLGGVQIKIGDLLIDNSVKNRLKIMKEAIS